MVKGGALKPLDRYVNHGEPDMSNWSNLIEKIHKSSNDKVTVGLVAKYVDNTDTYLSVTEALKSAAWANGIDLDIKWINSEKATDTDFASVDGLLVPGGFGSRGLNGKIAAASYALKNNKSYLGICLGLQMAVIAAARHGGLKHAGTEELDTDNPENVIYIMPDQKGKESTGGTMRLGDYPAVLKSGTKTAKIYGTKDITERHRHRYEVNQKFLPEIEKGGIIISGTSPDGKLVEFIEAPAHKFFVATQAHPEFKSRPMRPHPLFVNFIKSLKRGENEQI
jgi:CTP synthase